MSFANATPYQALPVPMSDPAGHEVLIAIVKASFDVLRGGRLALSDVQAPVLLHDEVWTEDDPATSLKTASDLCIEKGGTDVVVLGEAISSVPVTSMDVAVKVRDTIVPLRVHGPRFFEEGALASAIGPAAPVVRVPIVYEKAYGGMTDDYLVVESRNPAGVGVARSRRDLAGKPAPQIEHPARPHLDAGDAHEPVGFGPIMSHWSPRLELAGTFDDAWKATRMPLMPTDFNVLTNNIAHPSLVFRDPLVPGDEVLVHGMSEHGLLHVQVPNLGVVIRARFDVSGKVTVRPWIDTLVVRPGDRRIEVVVRHAFRQGRGRDVLREVCVDRAD
jgi:hypothetical protein